MTIKTKIFLMVLVAAVLFISTGFILSNSEKKRTIYFDKENIASSFSKGVFELNLLTNDFKRHSLKRTLRQWNQKFNSLMEIINTNKTLFHKELFYFKEIEQALGDLKTIFLKLNKEIVSKELDARLQTEDLKFLLYEARLSALSQNVINSAEALKNLIHSQLEISQNNASRMVLFLFLFYSVLIVFFSWIVFDSVLKPVIFLVKSTEIIGKGDFGHVIKVSKKDEIGVLSQAFNEMTNRLKEITVHRSELIKEIEERKKAERRIRESQELFKAVFEQTGGYCLLLQPTDNGIPTILDANKAACRAHGYTRKEMIGRPVSDLDDEEGKKLCRQRTKIIMSGKTLVAENDHVRKDGSIFPVAVYANRIDFEDKPPIIVSTEFDITDKRKAEAEKRVLETHLQQAQKMDSIGTLAGGIAHDFNNILFPILGYAEMLLEDIPEDSPFRKSLKGIYTSALRAKDLIKQILTFSRQENSELRLMKMQPIIKEALKLIRSTIPTTIEIIQDINPDCGVIKADPTQIHQIVMNLTTNAYHAMEETGGEMKVSLKQMEFKTLDLINPNMAPGIYACLTVADTGKGMDKILTDKIFDPFFTTKAIGKGTGMGLSVVHGIVTAMWGAIHVYSEPGKGTQFHVYLPVEKSLFEEQATTSKAQIQGGTEEILLVDDEQAILTMEKRMLERLGYQVTSRISSLEALEAFRNNPDRFDLVITDMAMPNMPGDKLSVELTKIRPAIPVLLCTGFSENMSKEKAASLGIKGFLFKPIVMKDLAQKIREVLDKK